MKLQWKNLTVIATLIVATLGMVALPAQKQSDEELLRVRESVWRIWCAGDIKALEPLVPGETIVISSGEEKWKHQAEVLQSSADFHAKGGKLIRLEFPHTEVQHFGDVALVWSRYIVELEVDGKRSTTSGRVTEVFVRKNGRWTNPGWHTDEEK